MGEASTGARVAPPPGALAHALDDPDSGVGSRMPTLRDRLPADLRDAPAGAEFDTPTLPLGLPDGQRVGGRDGQPDRALGDAHELGPGRCRSLPRTDARAGQANGLFGAASMAAIAPFRYLICTHR